jgi:predicted nucleic acid-binding protein
MPGTAYVDSSALLKLAVREPETAALEADLAARDGLVASRLAVVECRRAAQRASHRRVLQTIDEILDAIYLIEVTPAILDDAGAADPPLLRSLDAIHLATALSLSDPGMEVITYDRRFADAARANGLTVVQPGLKSSASSAHLV